MTASGTSPNGGTATGEIATPPPASAAVLEWLLTGASESDILTALRAKYPDVDVDATLAAVRDHLAREGTPDTDALRGWVLLSYRELYRRMLEVGDFDGARKVLKDITQTVGLSS